MKRREFIAVTAALLVSPRHLLAQGKPRRIGYLGGFRICQLALCAAAWAKRAGSRART